MRGATPRAVTTAAPLRHQAGGAGSWTSSHPRTTTLPLGLQQNASPFCDPLRCRVCACRIGTCRLGLITVWLPVRVLPAPPRSPALTPSSPSPRNTLDFPRFGTGVMARSRSLRETKTVRKRIGALRLWHPKSVSRCAVKAPSRSPSRSGPFTPATQTTSSGRGNSTRRSARPRSRSSPRRHPRAPRSRQ